MAHIDLQSDACTGCSACANICPRKAIVMIQDKCGFYVPQISSEKCTNCGLCKKACPIGRKKELEHIDVDVKAYAAYSKDPLIRRKSSSGGIFSVLALHVLEQNGIVYGAAFDENFKVVHIGIRSKEDLGKLRGSKYVQSFISEELFAEIKSELEKGTQVLFSGTPCQVAGLRHFLNKDYSNLLSVDLVCHGVPSPEVWKEYLRNYEGKRKQKIAQYNFRDKKKSWKYYNTLIIWEDGRKTYHSYLKDSFMKLFLHHQNPCLRNSCYLCEYASSKRIADITLGDFWNYIPSLQMPDLDEGISCVACNTEKGGLFFKKNLQILETEQRDFSEIIRGNPTFTAPFYAKDETKKIFWDVFAKDGYEAVVKKFPTPFKISLYIFLSQYCPRTLAILVFAKKFLKRFFLYFY